MCDHTLYYEKDRTAWFFSKKDTNWELSNMAGGMPLRFEEKRWNSSEQLYQASKYSPNVECVPASAKTERGKIPNAVIELLWPPMHGEQR